MIRSRGSGEQLHSRGTYRAHQGVDEPRPDAGTDVSDWQSEAGGHALLVGHVGEGQVGLGHADGQCAEALGNTTTTAASTYE